MELSILRDEFLRGVNIVHNVAIARGTMPILSHLLIQALDNRICLYGT
ncbi:MAG: DNA polymerase III subunit beta, partial [bacterium]